MLEIKSLQKTFVAPNGQERTVLGDISLTVPKNQFVCLLGASGCGKTTLLRIVSGLSTPDGGEVSLDGRPIRGPGRDRSFVFQNYGLLPWRNVMGNVELGLEIAGIDKTRRRAICQNYIDRVRLTGFEGHYPHQISGGMQQRVALARAFSKEPKLLLMDEPFAAVDAQTREHLQQELLEIWSTMQTTVLFVTHSIDEAIYLGDRVIVMSRQAGRIVADVTTALPRDSGGETNLKSLPRFETLRRELRVALSEQAA